MSAVMYVITGPVEDGNPFNLTWKELHRMRDSGRWDIQPHAADGHVEIVTDPAGTTAPFYANRRYTRSDGFETFAAYTQRVATDVYDVKDDFRRQNIPSETFAVPYGDHGQHAADPRIPRFLDDLLATQFRVVFVQAAGERPALHAAGRRRRAVRGAHGHDDRRAARLARAARPGERGDEGASSLVARAARRRAPLPGDGRREGQDRPLRRADAAGAHVRAPERRAPPACCAGARRPGRRAVRGRATASCAARAVVGQTPRRTMRIRVRVGRTYTLTVAAVNARRPRDALPGADRRARHLPRCRRRRGW